MRIVFYGLVVGVSAVVTFGLSWLIWKLSHRYRLYPKIRARDVHTRPTPRLGGVAMFFGMLAAVGIASFLPPFESVFDQHLKVLAILGASVLIVGTGVADDIWDLDWMTKLAAQIGAGFLLAWGGVQLSTLPIGGISVFSPGISLAVTVVAVVLVMNAINFIDGLDGLVAGVALIGASVFFVYTYLLQRDAQTPYFNLASLVTAVLIGACIGFLPWNFRPAKLFMGDAGALLVGLLLATSTISVTGQVDPAVFVSDRSALFPAYIPLLLPLGILVLPLLDFGLAVLRRLRAGKSPFSADRLHLHHRLLDMGHSHLHAVLIFYAWTTVVSVGGLSFLFLPWPLAGGLTLAGLIVCAIVTLAPLGRRKAAETAAQKTSETELDEEAAAADGLDAASTGSLATIPSEGPTP